MAKEQRPFVDASRDAQQIVEDLRPYCLRIEVAGSIRRRRPTVGDTEIVAIPRYGAAGLFGTERESLLYRHIHATPGYRFTKGNNPQGRYYQLEHALAGQIDLFLAAADNFGILWLIRTGSWDFSASVLAAWKRRQGIDTAHQGSVDGRLVDRHGAVVPTLEEAEVFRLIGYPVVPPELRNAPISQVARPLVRKAVG